MHRPNGDGSSSPPQSRSMVVNERAIATCNGDCADQRAITPVGARNAVQSIRQRHGDRKSRAAAPSAQTTHAIATAPAAKPDQHCEPTTPSRPTDLGSAARPRAHNRSPRTRSARGRLTRDSRADVAAAQLDPRARSRPLQPRVGQLRVRILNDFGPK